MTRADAFKALFRGAGLIVFLFWAILAYGPIYDMIENRNEPNIWASVGFLLTSFYALVGAYAAAMAVAPAASRSAVHAWFKARLPLITIWAAIWVSLYPYIG